MVRNIAVPAPVEIESEEFDLTKDREGTRKWLAITLVGSLVFLLFAVTWAALFGDTPTERMDLPVKTVIPTLAGLAAAVTGFYYASED